MNSVLVDEKKIECPFCEGSKFVGTPQPIGKVLVKITVFCRECHNEVISCSFRSTSSKDQIKMIMKMMGYYDARPNLEVQSPKVKRRRHRIQNDRRMRAVN